MALAYASDSDITPHMSQWRNLVRSSNGTFTSTDFGQLVEDYTHLFPYETVLEDALKDSKKVPTPKVISSTLSKLAEVTDENDKQLTIVGGPILAWFAAVAEWLFDLHIAIYSTGHRLYVNHESQGTQLLLVYDQKPGLSAQTGSWKDDAERVKESASEPEPDAKNIYFAPLGGRVVWNSLLPHVFGRAFHHLDHEETRILGTALGAASRAFQGLTEDPDLDDIVPAQKKANTASFRVGLVQTLSNWLPELRHLRGRMELQQKLPFQDARKTYFEQIRHLQKVCGCGICAATDANASHSKPKNPPHGYCLTVVVETIIALGLSLSRTIVSAQKFLTHYGIQSVYKNQAAKKMEAKQFEINDIRHFKIVFGNEWNAPDARRLQNCAEIFSGSRPTKDIPENLVALSHEGIWVYMVKLEKGGSAHSGNNDGLIRVVSGAICVRQKIFTRACLGQPADADEFENFWEDMKPTHLSQPLYFK